MLIWTALSGAGTSFKGRPEAGPKRIRCSTARRWRQTVLPLNGNPPGAVLLIMPMSRVGVIAVIETQFVRDQWYIAAFSREVGRELVGRTVCGEPIVLYRLQAGEPVALADRCVHRRYPLSQSTLDGDSIVCGYHGFTYESGGACVYVPAQERIPRTAGVTRYPVMEKDSFVWVWIGEGGDPDAVGLPRAQWFDDPAWAVVGGLEHLPARHALLVDNLLDLSHETYLHAGTIGTPEVAATPITTTVDDDNGIVYVSRHMADVQCPPFYATSTGIPGRIDRWQDIEYRPPCLYLLHVRVAPTGVRPGPDGQDRDAFHVKVMYGITPETANSTHIFWSVARDFAQADTELSDFLERSNRTVIAQDVAALSTLEQVVVTDAGAYRELSVNIDTGGLAARRLLKRMRRGTP
jgi:phenylpropionate dioxygenase-like ring-hydroxylating dioxygenase large terminal subunit